MFSVIIKGKGMVLDIAPLNCAQ